VFKSHGIERRPQEAGAEAAEVFETTDFYLACYLRCDGFRLAGIRRDGRRSVFRFEDRTDRQAVTLAFFNNEGTVRPLAYSAAIKDLKALIHNL
jgi:nucleoside-triphosphatase THEP1